MSYQRRLRFVEEASRRRETDDSRELRLWNARQTGNILDRDTSSQWYTGQDLEFAKPSQAREDFDLRSVTLSASRLVEFTW